MSYLYISLLLISISFPLFFSIFYIDFIKSWKYFIISTTIVAVFFLIWDAIFTEIGIWGFSTEYYLGILLLSGTYTFMLKSNIPINGIMFIFGFFVLLSMTTASIYYAKAKN